MLLFRDLMLLFHLFNDTARVCRCRISSLVCRIRDCNVDINRTCLSISTELKEAEKQGQGEEASAPEGRGVTKGHLHGGHLTMLFPCVAQVESPSSDL